MIGYDTVDDRVFLSYIVTAAPVDKKTLYIIYCIEADIFGYLPRWNNNVFPQKIFLSPLVKIHRDLDEISS